MAMLVSILIPCYDAERWVGQAIESALAQTWPEKEVIVIDDGSTDRSLEVIKKFDGRIRWETGPNRGGNAARNRLLELAKGEWLQYLDADDYLLPEKVANQVRFLGGQAEADVVFGPVTIEHMDEGGVERELLAIPPPHDPWVLLALWRLPQTGSVLWRKQAVIDVGGWKTDQPCCQEHELFLRMITVGNQFAYCAHNGAVYREWHGDSVSTRDISQVHRHRLDIEQRAEDFLLQNNGLTVARLTAINQARFDIARMAWLYDRQFAEEIIKALRRSQPDFVPGNRSGRLHYRLAYRALGFSATERLADWTRRFRLSKLARA